MVLSELRGDFVEDDELPTGDRIDVSMHAPRDGLFVLPNAGKNNVPH